jgi:pimeloyl-ACP methyl ester carboxylesterase
MFYERMYDFLSAEPHGEKPKARSTMPQLLYVHGSGHTQDSFADQVARFAGSDALSLPGHPAGTALSAVAECAAWLAAYIDWRRVAPVVVAGNSLGGAIALQWALERPDQAAGIVLIGTGARLRVSADIFDLLDSQWPGGIKKLVDWSLGADAPQALHQRVASWHELVGRESTKTDYAACNAFDVTERLGELRIPALILVGAQDAMTPVKYSTFLHDRLEGSTLTIVPNAGHLVHAERPAESNAAIAAFLERLG